MKAFLSHATKNKEFVREVVKKLGRQRCIFDEQSFTTGDDIKKSIGNKLDSTSIFVLFLTKESLDSIWVGFEIEEACYRSLYDKIDTSLVYIIDDSVDIKNVPLWMRRAIVSRLKSPTAIALDIQHKLAELAYDNRQKYFVGRIKDQESLEGLVTPVDGSRPPNVLSISGLPGVGRRTLIKKLSSQLFELKKHSEMRVESGDTINDICAKLADLIEPYGSHEELKDIVNGILDLPYDEALERSLGSLSKIISNNQLPIFVDEGGLLNDAGGLSNPIKSILKHIPDTTYICLITHRKILGEESENVVKHKVKPLTLNESKRLIKKISGDYKNISLTHNELNEFAEYIKGYPPAAYFSVEQCAEYGKELVLNDKFALVNFSSTRFAKFLKENKITRDQQEILKLLSSYSPLPLSAISAYISDQSNSEDIHRSMYELIDKSLSMVDNNSLYYISTPISDSVRKEFGAPEYKKLKPVSTELSYFIQNTDENRKLDLSRVWFRLSSMIGDSESVKNSIHLRNDFIKLVETSYHERLYDKAIKFGLLALEECPDSVGARTYLIRSYVQEEKWSAATTHIEELKKYTVPRDVYFQKGFMLRKQGLFSDALDAFIQSKKEGRRGAAISREIAHCYLLMHEYRDAIKYINEALEKQPDNSHQLDLAAKIYIKSGDVSEAYKILERLKLIDDSEHYKLTKSILYFSIEDYSRAVEMAECAIRQGSPKYFSARVQLVKSLIRNGDYDKARDEMVKIDDDFSGRNNDLRLSLRISLLMRQGLFKDALEVSNRFENTESQKYTSIRNLCLRKLSEDVSVNYQDRKEYLSLMSADADADADLLDVIDEF